MCTGTSKARYTTDVLINGGEMFDKLYQPSPSRFLYPLIKNSILLSLISPIEGYLDASLKEEIAAMNLDSVVEVLPSVEKGQFLQKTKDLPTLAGTVLMVHESMKQLEWDIQRVRSAESSLALYPVTNSQ